MITTYLCWKEYVEPLATLQLWIEDPSAFSGRMATELEQGTPRGEPAYSVGACPVSNVKHRHQGVEEESVVRECVCPLGTASPVYNHTLSRIETRIAKKPLGGIRSTVSQRVSVSGD